MKSRSHFGPARQRGLSLVTTLVLMLATLGLGVAVMSVGAMEERLIANTKDRDLALQFFHPAGAASGNRLEGRCKNAANSKHAVQRIERHQHHGCGAIRICDHAAVLPQIISVDLRNHQRHVRFHSKH